MTKHIWLSLTYHIIGEANTRMTFAKLPNLELLCHTPLNQRRQAGKPGMDPEIQWLLLAFIKFMSFCILN